MKIDKILSKYKFTKVEKAFLLDLNRKASVWEDLASPVVESEETEINGELYFCRRVAYINEVDNDLWFEYIVYKWSKTYREVPLTPNSDKTFKFKNWEEILHTRRREKKDLNCMILAAITILNNAKKSKN